MRLDLLRLLAPVARVSLWRRGSGGSVAVVASVGGLPSPRQAREVAERALRGETCSRGGRVHAAAAGGSAAIVFDCAPADLERVLPLAERLAVVAVSVDPADEERDEGDRDVGDELVRRIGADLHDGPLQTLALAAGTLQAAQRRLEPGAPGARTAAAELRRAATLVDRAAAELRRISCGAVGVAESMALPALLHDEVEAFREQTRLDVHLVIQGPVERLERAQAEAILRIAQEALANVRAHAGARRVEVVLVVGDDLSWLDVVDDGRGFDVGRATARAAHERRLGLSGMTTRAKRSGGAIEVRSSPGGGSRIAVTLPTRGARLSGRRGRRDAGGANGPA